MKNKPGRPYCGYTSTGKKIPNPIFGIIGNAVEGWKVDNKNLGEQAATDKLRGKLESE